MVVTHLPRSVTQATWPVLVFAVIVFGVGLWAMTKLNNNAGPADITALAASVLGVVGTHVGHVAGHELAAKKQRAETLAAGVERLHQLKKDGALTAEEFTRFKADILAN
jgi:hypothetical protein